MDINVEKIELMELLLRTENENILKKIRSVFKSEEEQFNLSDEQWAIVEEEREAYKKGDGINYSWEEAKKIISGDSY